MPVGNHKFMTNQTIPERRKFQVLKRTTRSDVVGVKVGDKEFKFQGNSEMFETDDQGLARAIHDSSGQGGTGDVVVVPTEKPINTTHQRTFTVGIAFDENGKIIR